MLLHQIDNMDSKMEAMRAHIAKDRQATGVWTGYNPALERIVLKKQQYLVESQEPAAEAAAPLPTAAERDCEGSAFIGVCRETAGRAQERVLTSAKRARH